jgi:hypothetical protein
MADDSKKGKESARSAWRPISFAAPRWLWDRLSREARSADMTASAYIRQTLIGRLGPRRRKAQRKRA